jgi:hypothetical protein
MKQYPFRLELTPHVAWRIAYDEHHYTIFRDEHLVGQGAFGADGAVQPDEADVLAFAIAQAGHIERVRRGDSSGEDRETADSIED